LFVAKRGKRVKEMVWGTGSRGHEGGEALLRKTTKGGANHSEKNTRQHKENEGGRKKRRAKGTRELPLLKFVDFFKEG